MSGFWLRHRQTVGVWVLAVVVALACVALGRWQWHRFHDKHDRKQLVERNYDAPPVPLTQLLPSAAAPWREAMQWRQVRVTGRYDVSATTLVRNRPHDVGGSPTFGYEVLVPLVLDDGSALLVDRGWIPSGTAGSAPGERPDAVPAPPSGPVDVVARLRPSEPRRAQRTPPGQVGSIAVRQVAQLTGLDLYPPYGALMSESPAPAEPLTSLGPPELDGGEGINASYAVQWWVFAVLALLFPFWLRRRQAASAQEGEHPDGDAGLAPTASRPARRRR
ncbi:MAG: SURF1 family cytochrome oxidase biogenesis protein, partial [Angustibacter sp.]